MSSTDAERLRVAVLGPVQAWLGDREIDLGQARQRVLFAVLAAAVGRRVGRTELIDAIWGQAAPATAAGSVYTYVSGLRRVLGARGHDLLVSEASGYALRLGGEDLDSERFARLVADAADRRAAGDLPAAAALLDDALRLWRGDAYAGMESDRLALERTHLQQERFAAVGLRARILLELGEDDVVAELIAMIHRYPLHEPLHELLMLALHRQGRNAEALDVFRSARRTLAGELGVEPGMALHDMHRRVLSAATAADRGALPQPPMPDHVARALRDEGARTAHGGAGAKADRLLAMPSALAAGTGGAAWIEGGPASGKTELLAGALACAVEAGCQVARVTADELDRWVPLQVIARALGLSADWTATTDGVLEHIRAVCALTPLLLAVDDLDCADADTRRFWPRLVSAAHRIPLLVVAAARRGALDELRSAVEDRSGVLVDLAVPPAGPPPDVLRGLSADARRVLSRAALLGAEFTTDDLVAVAGRSPFDLVRDLEEAMAAEVLADTGGALVFRHRVQRDELRRGFPPAERATLRGELARVLDRRDASPIRVAAQLAEDTPAGDGWVAGWAAVHLPELTARAPELTAMLARRILEAGGAGDTQRAALLTACVRADIATGGRPVAEAREAIGRATGRDRREEMRHALAVALLRGGDEAAARRELEEAIRDPAVPETWRLRHRTLAGPGDDAYGSVLAEQERCRVHTRRREHEESLRAVDRALALVRDHESWTGLHVELLGDRVRTLQNLDRLTDADRTLRDAALLAIGHELAPPLRGTSAVQNYWLGRWDDVLAELDGAPAGGEPGLHAVAAVIAVRRADHDLADEHALAEVTEDPRGFLIAARAVITGHRRGDAAALGILEPLLALGDQPRHHWLPHVVRVALASGDRGVAERAAGACGEEEARESPPAGARHAATHCRALLSGDPAFALSAAAGFGDAGRVVQRAATLEDAAVLLAARRRPHEAADAGGEAAGVYASLGAAADLRRIERRLAEYGVTSTAPGPAAEG